MARSDRIFKRSYNDCLDLLSAGRRFESVSGLARSLSASRTTARRVIERLTQCGLIEADRPFADLRRDPREEDYFSHEEVRSTDDVIEAAFMEWVIKDALAPGTLISEAEVARKLGLSSSSVREFLIRLSRYGFIRKEPRGHWIVEGFTKKYATELLEVRLLFDMKAIDNLLALPDEDPFWVDLMRMRTRHLDLRDTLEPKDLRFSELDSQFHRLIYSGADNRFMLGFLDAIALIFHYHYRWNKKDERVRNRKALDEHLAIIEALLMKDARRARVRVREHLITAQSTLLSSIDW